MLWLDLSAVIVAALPGTILLCGGKRKLALSLSAVLFSVSCCAWGLHPQGGTEYAFSGGSVFFCVCVLCLSAGELVAGKIRRKKREKEEQRREEMQTSSRVAQTVPVFTNVKADYPMPATNADLQLDYALRVLEKLAGKKLSVADKLETDAIKSTVDVYKDRNVLTCEETRKINRYLASLLKLMSKYSV